MSKKFLSFVFAGVAMMISFASTSAQNFAVPVNPMRQTSPEFFKSDEARRVGDQILIYQRVTGGWPKNIDMAAKLDDATYAAVMKDKSRVDDSTIDNGATTSQMNYLARLFAATHEQKYRESFLKAVRYLLSGQYENGGWPQFWPEMRDYQPHITFNDDAIVNTLTLFSNIRDMKEPFVKDLSTAELRDSLDKSISKGIECILATQIVVNGEPTVWCQQHDENTLAPAYARAYELPSFCSAESAGIVRFLMNLPSPDKRIINAVNGAMKWFDKYKLTGLRVVRTVSNGERDTKLVEDPSAGPLWARFYDLKYNEPYVCDRDGIMRRHLEEIGPERRSGYSWYNSNAASLYPLYDAWADKYDRRHKVKIDINSKGANVNGTIEMFRKPVIDRADFDVVVKPGESIQDAISKAPATPDKPFKILILKGTYNQKVIIDRPNIVLVGEDRNETKIIYAETMATKKIKEWNGQAVGNGVIVLQDGADDCIITGLTVYNNYGTTIEDTTTHQMTIYGRGTRTIVINCNVWSDGNDALSLWAPESNGMYYHADLEIKCRGVDFLCPRGWCYATRCKFYGDGMAMIWHDGRGDKNKKLVITNSYFDAASPTLLGRYHHDSQFYLIKCHMSSNVLDGNIHYAYSDKVLDPCVWGLRTYFYGCTREGGHSGWLDDNLHKSAEKVDFFGVTAVWTFGGKWNPEVTIRDLWNVVGYTTYTTN